ncbi:MAG: AMIN domain-containing protein, partial [Beijerinckiaceae bacterium]
MAVALCLAPVDAAARKLAQSTPIVAPAPAQPLPVAIDVEVKAEGPTTTLTFLVSRAVEGRAILLERPDRVIVDLPEVNFQFGPEQGRKGEGLIQSFRYGLFGSGRSRLVIDLTA